MNLLAQSLYNSLLFGITAAIIAVLISPLQFIKIIRQETLNGYKIIIANAFNQGKLKIFFRGAAPYALLQFISSAAFGFSDFLSNIILQNNKNLLLAVLIRSLLGGTLETIATISTEVREISRNKGELMKKKGKPSSILLPIWIRNSIFWIASTLSFEIYQYTNITASQSAILAFFLGIIAGIFSIPPDLLATQNCGAEQNMTAIARLNMIIKQNGIDKTFAGTKIRIIQIALFSLTTEYIMTVVSR